MKTIGYAVVLLALLSFASCEDQKMTEEVPTLKRTQFTVTAKGPSVGQIKVKTDPETGAQKEVTCYLVELVDPQTGETVGTIEDCDIETVELPDGAFLSRVLSKFILYGRGTITSRGEVLQKPVGDGKYKTSSTPSEDNIVNVTSEFAGASGKVMLRGEIDMNQYDHNIIIFNCNFTIDVESM